MKLYLDLCCWNRPFDDTSQDRIRAEAAALDVILDRIRRQEDHLCWSDFLDLELAAAPDPRRRQWIIQHKSLAIAVIADSPSIEGRARSLNQLGMKPLDAFHLAAAETCADILVTVDDRFWRQVERLSALTVRNPVNYCEEVNRGQP